MSRLINLMENKTYTITFDVTKLYLDQEIKCVYVLMKLEKSIKLRDVDTKIEKWFRTETQIDLLDEIPVKYLRKEKLKNIKKLENE